MKDKAELIEIEKTEDQYLEMLNELYGTVEICGMKFDAGYALKELDPTAFRCGLSDEPLRWKCSECDQEFEEDEYDEGEEHVKEHNQEAEQ